MNGVWRACATTCVGCSDAEWRWRTASGVVVPGSGIAANPPAWPITLTVNGAAPVGASNLGPRLLELPYPLRASAGHSACPADAANIVSVDGYKLAAARGTVA